MVQWDYIGGSPTERGSVKRFWVIQWVLYNCDLLWVLAREFLKHIVGFCVVSCSAVGSAVVYCGLE